MKVTKSLGQNSSKMVGGGLGVSERADVNIYRISVNIHLLTELLALAQPS